MVPASAAPVRYPRATAFCRSRNDGRVASVVTGAARSPERLARTRIAVEALKSGTRVRVLFEDREVKAAEGFFVDDFRGQDLYQRFGGGPTTCYGDTPVAVHVYEIG